MKKIIYKNKFLISVGFFSLLSLTRQSLDDSMTDTKLTSNKLK